MLIYMPVKIYIDPILPSLFSLSPIEVVPRIEYEFQVIARLTKIIKNSKGGLGSKIHWKKSPVSVTFKTSVHNCPEHCISPELYFLLHGNPELSKEYNSISTKEEEKTIEYNNQNGGPQMRASIKLPKNSVSSNSKDNINKTYKIYDKLKINSSHTSNITYHIYEKLKMKNKILSLENEELKKGMARIDSILKNTGGILLDLKKEQAFPYLKIVPLAMWGILFLCLFGPKFQKIVKVCFNFGKSEDKVVDQLI